MSHEWNAKKFGVYITEVDNQTCVNHEYSYRKVAHGHTWFTRVPKAAGEKAVAAVAESYLPR